MASRCCPSTTLSRPSDPSRERTTVPMKYLARDSKLAEMSAQYSTT